MGASLLLFFNMLYHVCWLVCAIDWCWVPFFGLSPESSFHLLYAASTYIHLPDGNILPACWRYKISQPVAIPKQIARASEVSGGGEFELLWHAVLLLFASKKA